ncbi:MAG TPA: hypothetical protein PK131_01735 [Candidatus Woesebacteria bacterium]|nr:hypothetical protein [Candidatus Woesebacteria bacterium]HRS23062.1 hypothetical protein [Candidatus Woesebacteria bacterium]
MLENKERLPVTTPEQLPQPRKTSKEVIETIERKVFVPKEVKPWLEKIEEEENPIIPTALPTSQKPYLKTVLPISKEVFLKGLNQKVSDAGHWLATFVLRIIKIKGGRVQFQEK